MEEQRGRRRRQQERFQYCTDPSGQEILYLRALQDHSGRNPIDPTLQDKVLIPNDFFEYIYHIGCALSLHSIINSGLILGGTKFKQGKTDSVLHGRESHEKGSQRSASYKQKIRCIGSIYSLLNEKD